MNEPANTPGEALKKRRLELGRSIEQMSALTRIHAKTLTAIEENQYSDLPARAFTRGFIVSYSKALGLNGESLIKEFQDYLEQKFSERPSREQGHRGYVFESKENEQNKRWMIIGASVAAFFAIVVLLLFKPQNHKHKEKHKEFTEEAVINATPSDEDMGAEGLPIVSNTKTSTNTATSTSTLVATAPTSLAMITGASTTETKASVNILPLTPSAATPKPVVIPVASISPIVLPIASPAISPTSSPSVAADPLKKGDDLAKNEIKKKIAFEALEDVWVRYQVDQKPAMLLILRKGKFLVIKAKDKLHFETNNASALRYRTRTRDYKPLELKTVQIDDHGLETLLEGGMQSAPKIPDTIPQGAQ